MNLLNDINGKLSSKRIAAWLLLSAGLIMAILTGFEKFCYSETLILGIIGIAGGVLFGTAFEKSNFKTPDIPDPDKEQK